MLLRHAGLWLASIIYGGAFFVPVWPAGLALRTNLGVIGLLPAVVLIAAVVAAVAAIARLPLPALERFVAWFFETQFELLRWGLGLGEEAISLSVQRLPPGPDVRSNLLQLVLFAPIAAGVSLISAVLILLSLPVFLGMLVTGSTSARWTRLVCGALRRLVPPTRFALLGRRWQEVVTIAA